MALTREFLKSLKIDGLNDDILQKIMDEHGDTINKNKTSFDETKKQLDAQIAKLESRADITPEDLSKIQEKLNDADEQLKSFNGVNITELKGELQKAQAKVTEMESTHQETVAKLEADASLRENLAKVDFSSNYAQKGVYEDLKGKVKYEDGKLTGFEEALAEIREKQPSAFVEVKEKDEKDEGARHSGGGKTPPKRDVPILI